MLRQSPKSREVVGGAATDLGDDAPPPNLTDETHELRLPSNRVTLVAEDGLFLIVRVFWTEYVCVFCCTIFSTESRLLDLTTSLALHILDNLPRRAQRSSKDKHHGLQCHSVPTTWIATTNCRPELRR